MEAQLEAMRRFDRPAAVVYPAFTLASYAVIRNLGERGVPVVALNPTTHPHMRSRYVVPMTTPPMAEAPEAFFRQLAAIAAALPHGGVLYLMEDVYVYLAHKFRASLPENLHFSLMDDEALAMSLDKRAMFAAAERAGVPLPWTLYPESTADLEAARADLPFPCVVKPLVSRFSFGDGPEAQAIEAFPRAFGGKCAGAANFDELRAIFDRTQALGIPVCVQEMLEGPADRIYGVHLYADRQHEMLGAAVGRKLRQVPGDFGTGTFCEVLRRDEALEYARRFVEETRYHGIGGIEFKEDPRTGVLKLIEINPRGVHWMGSALLAGVELPYLKYRDLLGDPIRQEQARFSGRWIDGKGDRRYFELYRRDRRSPYHVGAAAWAASLLGASPAVLNWRDPLPGLLKLVPDDLGAKYLALKRRFSEEPA